MDVLVVLGRWAAHQGASWLLRNRWRIAAIPQGGAVDGFGPGEDEQIAVAQAIVAAGTAAGVGTRGMIVGIATALKESGLRELPSGDRDSAGPFQQRPSQGWGTPEQVMDA